MVFVANTISESDVYLFTGITGDLNPAHVNEDYAKEILGKSQEKLSIMAEKNRKEVNRLYQSTLTNDFLT